MVPIFIISIKDCEVSQSYTRTAINSFNFSGHKLEIFDAITPKDLSSLNQLTFDRLEYGNRRRLTPTEISVFYSHYFLWKRCVELDSPIIILEHDSLLTGKLLKYKISKILSYRFKKNKVSIAPASGLYLIPEDANKLLESVKAPISLQVDGHILKTLKFSPKNFHPIILTYIFDGNVTIEHK